MLGLRHLEVIAAAAAAIGDSRSVDRDALKRAWVLGHAGVVAFFEPGALYFVPADRYWELFEAHRTSRDSEIIAWTAARTPIYTDECYAECLLEILERSYGRYWNEFPQGVHISDAVAIGEERISIVIGYECEDSGRLAGVIDDLRSSLRNVDAAMRALLLDGLYEIENDCSRAGAPGPAD